MPESAAVGTERLHAFDSLRGAMMLLGLVLHSAMTYVTFPTGEAWPFQDPRTHVGFDLLVSWIHTFRMPVFFVAAGFFAALLHSKRGTRGLLRNRVRRIAIPLAVGWFLLLPPVFGASIYGQSLLGTPPDLELSEIPLGELLDHLMHLWFLYHLLIFYTAAAALLALSRFLPDAAPAALSRLAARGIPHAAAPWALALLSLGPLLAMKTGGVDNSDSLLPPLRILATYGIFFAFGWLLFPHRQCLPWFRERAWRHSALGLLSFLPYLIAASLALTPPGSARAYPVAMAALSLTTWYWVYAFLGLFLRFAANENRHARFLADASYWMYLVHLPLTMWLPIVFFDIGVPAVLKFCGVLTLTTAVTLLTYRYLVRSTAIGAVLNGRRYPPAWP